MIDKQVTPDIGKPTHASKMTPESEYFGLATLWHNVPWHNYNKAEPRTKVDAIIAWPGIELDRAVHQGVGFWNDGIGKHLLVAGYHVDEVAERVFSYEGLLQYYGVEHEKEVHTQVNARHAGEQGKWTAEKIVELNIKSAIVCLPSFHSLRAGLGTLAWLKRMTGNTEVVLFASCPPISPFERRMFDVQTKQRNLTMIDVLWGEINGGKPIRIPAYQTPAEDGTVQNLPTEEFLQWLAWVYEQPKVKDQLIAYREL